MSDKEKRVLDREFKLAALNRMMAGENVRALNGVWPDAKYVQQPAAQFP
jgi:hypothetical protein